MTKQAKSFTVLISAATLAVGTAGYLLNTAFVSHTELEPVQRDVSALKQDMRELKAGVELGNCLALAEKRQTHWQECL